MNRRDMAYLVTNFLVGEMARRRASNNPVPRYLRGAVARSTPYKRRQKTIAPKKVYTTKGKTVDKKIQEIQKSLKADQASHIHRRRDVGGAGSTNGQVNNAGFDALNYTSIEASMANLRYYNPANPSVLTTADASTGTYTRQIHFKNVVGSCEVRNNYQVPAKVKVYLCTPKNDTNIAPASFFSAGVTDQTISGAVTSPLLYYSDINQVTTNWNMKCMKSKILDAGQQFTVTHSTGSFDYDPSIYDHHALQYQKKFKAFLWIIRVEGVIGHDTAGAEYRTLDAKVDCCFDTKFHILYDAGCNLEDFSYDDNSSAQFTNAGVVTNKPIADNQTYSVS